MSPDTRIRERLLDLAQDAPAATQVPASLVPRARRRIARTLVSGTLVLAILLGGGISAVRSIVRSEPGPAHPPATKAGIFAGMDGWIFYRDYRSHSLSAFDPAHPIHRVSLGIQAPGIPTAWSRDGRHLLFTFDHGFHVMGSDGSVRRLLQPGHPYSGSAGGSFSPDGSQVAYGAGSGFFVASVQGGSPRWVPAPRSGYAIDPQWSPDGSEIVYMGSTGRGSAVWATNPDGTGQRVLVDLSSIKVSEPGGLAWSPDGSMLTLFIDPTKYHAHIWVVNADGTGLRELTHGAHSDCIFPSWSPNGSRIAFRCQGITGGGNGVYTVTAEGRDLHRLGPPQIPIDLTIAWNPIRPGSEGS